MAGMIVPQFWAEARIQQSPPLKSITVRRSGWSDVSQEEAQAHAEARAQEAFDRIAAGEFAELLQWLRENIHVHGKRYSSRELVKKATGSPLSAEPLLRHLRAKAQRHYGV